jgi:tetratricopeptide (TPR) repeat protein
VSRPEPPVPRLPALPPAGGDGRARPGDPVSRLPDEAHPGAGLIGQLSKLVVQMFSRPPKLTETPGASAGLRPFIVVLAVLDNDPANEVRANLAQALAGRPGIITKTPNTPVSLQEPATSSTLAMALVKARQVLTDESADLVIWGAVVADGVRIYFTPVSGEENRPTGFALASRMDFPKILDITMSDLFHAVVVSSIEANTPAQREMISQLVPGATGILEVVTKRLPSGLTPRQQTALMIACGHIAWAAGVVSGQLDWFDKADAAYTAAQRRLQPKDKTPTDDAMLLRHRAGIQMAKAERLGTEKAWDEAIAAYRESIAALPRVSFPTEWGNEQNRLGLALYRYDLKMARTDLLTEAIDAFRAALQIYTYNEHPRRWAEIMHNLAQAMQVYGDQGKNVEVLNRAIEACRGILHVRTRDSDPLGWAATMNTLGTALFLRDKHAGKSEGLEEAEAALRAAADTWRICGALKMAAVAEKNLGHIQRLNKLRESKPPGYRR